jgi:hypothetical protein
VKALEAAVRREFRHRPEIKRQRYTVNRIVAVTVVKNWRLKLGMWGWWVSRNKLRKHSSNKFRQLFKLVFINSLIFKGAVIAHSSTGWSDRGSNRGRGKRFSGVDKIVQRTSGAPQPHINWLLDLFPGGK